jgi:hypothetical protein
MDDFYHNIFNIFGFAPRPSHLSAAGRMLAELDRADAEIVSKGETSEELQAALRRCQVRSRWANWDQKAPGAQP